MLRTAAAAMPSPLRSATYSMLFGSRAATGIGIGIGEALTLERSDVNWNQAALLRVGGIGLAIARRQGFGKTVLLAPSEPAIHNVFSLKSNLDER